MKKIIKQGKYVDYKAGTTRYDVVAYSATGARSEIIESYSEVMEAIRDAARIGRKQMWSLFGNNDHNNGEMWNVDVDVIVDERGHAFDYDMPTIYTRYISTSGDVR